MPISRQQIDNSLSAGYNIVCSTCEKHYDGSCPATCGGPARNLDFPDYKGPIPREMFPSMCLSCGDQSIKYGVVAAGQVKFSVCENHRKVLHLLASHGTYPEPVLLTTLPGSSDKRNKYERSAKNS